jgi:hypothetical protein
MRTWRASSANRSQSMVLVSGMPIATITAPYVVAGCAFVPIPGNGPCVTGQWTVGTVRVLSQGQPIAILSGVSTCLPTGTPLIPVAAQARVIAT